MRIVWSEPALADLGAIHDYIARDSPHYAERLVRLLIAAADPLTDFPQLGRVVPEGDGRHREIVVVPYRLIYRVANDQVLVMAVIHGARDLTTSRSRDDVP